MPQRRRRHPKTLNQEEPRGRQQTTRLDPVSFATGHIYHWIEASAARFGLAPGELASRVGKALQHLSRG